MKNLFKALFKKAGTVIVNGQVYSGSSVVISGCRVSGNVVAGDLIIDGKRQAGAINLGAPISITVNGDVERLDVGNGKVDVAGACGEVKVSVGDVSCGDVSGSVHADMGSIKCGKVLGDVKASMGDITMRR